MEIKEIVTEFAARLQAALHTHAMEQAREAVLRALGGAPKRLGRPPKGQTSSSLLSLEKKPRKKPPRQLCPVPGCKNTAAPVFGMVCTEHKDVPKAKIKKYREARRAEKAGDAGAGTRKSKTAGRTKRRKVGAKGAQRTTRKRAAARASKSSSAAGTAAAA